MFYNKGELKLYSQVFQSNYESFVKDEKKVIQKTAIVTFIFNTMCSFFQKNPPFFKKVFHIYGTMKKM